MRFNGNGYQNDSAPTSDASCDQNIASTWNGNTASGLCLDDAGSGGSGTQLIVWTRTAPTRSGPGHETAAMVGG
jgi:hypothetical protein